MTKLFAVMANAKGDNLCEGCGYTRWACIRSCPNYKANQESSPQDNQIKVLKAWLVGLQNQVSRFEKTLARASLKPDPYVQSELNSLLGYLDSIDYLLKNNAVRTKI